MDVQNIRYKLEDAKRWLTEGGGERAKLIGVSAILSVLVVWLAINILPMLWPEPAGRELDTPGWRLVQDLNAALVAEPLYVDTSFIVETEDPLRLKLVGAVQMDEDLESLRAFVAKLRPENDYAIEVEVYEDIVNSEPPPEGGA